MRLIRIVGEACNRSNILKKLCYIEDEILYFSLRLRIRNKVGQECQQTMTVLFSREHFGFEGMISEHKQIPLSMSESIDGS